MQNPDRVYVANPMGFKPGQDFDAQSIGGLPPVESIYAVQRGMQSEMSSRSHISHIASTANTNLSQKVHRAQAPQSAYSRIAQARALARHNE